MGCGGSVPENTPILVEENIHDTMGRLRANWQANSDENSEMDHDGCAQEKRIGLYSTVLAHQLMSKRVMERDDSTTTRETSVAEDFTLPHNVPESCWMDPAQEVSPKVDNLELSDILETPSKPVPMPDALEDKVDPNVPLKSTEGSDAKEDTDGSLTVTTSLEATMREKIIPKLSLSSAHKGEPDDRSAVEQTMPGLLSDLEHHSSLPGSEELLAKESDTTSQSPSHESSQTINLTGIEPDPSSPISSTNHGSSPIDLGNLSSCPEEDADHLSPNGEASETSDHPEDDTNNRGKTSEHENDDHKTEGEEISPKEP